jgi:hypothetical protein
VWESRSLPHFSWPAGASAPAGFFLFRDRRMGAAALTRRPGQAGRDRG